MVEIERLPLVADVQDTLQTPSRHLSDTFQTPSKHLPDTFLTPSRQLPDTPFSFVQETIKNIQTPSRVLPDTCQIYPDTTQIHSDNFHTPKDHCSQFLSNPSGGWWVGGGLQVHNHAPSGPNLEVMTCKNSKLGQSMAKIW